MKNIIATWICLDDKKTGSYFPSAKGNSADKEVQNIYWRCICCFFTTARHNNPDATLVLFSNKVVLPQVDDTPIFQLLQKLKVTCYVTPFEFITPEGYYNAWRNQFYEFSIFKFISSHPDFNENDNFILLDSDCIIKGDLSPLFKEIQVHKCVTYIIDYKIDHKINGSSRKDMKQIFEELLQYQLSTQPAYHAGEIYASTIGIVNRIAFEFNTLWKQLLHRFYAGIPNLYEEAHVLSFLYFKNGFSGGQANEFVKRLWTDPVSFRNVVKEDLNLLIWHLPAEKRHGFRKFFNWLQKVDFNLGAVDANLINERLQSTFLVPNIPFQRKPYYAAKSIFKKIF